MRLIFITGSTDGLGRAAARTLMEEGHQVVLHTVARAAPAVADLALRSAGVVIGDLSSAVETRKIAEQVNGIGRMDAVIHKAGTYLEPSRGATPEGHAKTLTVNTLAPYMLTALIERPGRLATGLADSMLSNEPHVRAAAGGPKQNHFIWFRSAAFHTR
jgi:NAD(P)-dependent dehydrogenase (short-subunit alcohol dehydrogenase family)